MGINKFDSYELKISQKAVKELNRLPEPIFSRIGSAIESLVKNPFPSGSKRLVSWPGFRIRIGDYRVLYEVNTRKKLIIIYRVGHRKDVYR